MRCVVSYCGRTVSALLPHPLGGRSSTRLFVWPCELFSLHAIGVAGVVQPCAQCSALFYRTCFVSALHCQAVRQSLKFPQVHRFGVCHRSALRNRDAFGAVRIVLVLFILILDYSLIFIVWLNG